MSNRRKVLNNRRSAKNEPSKSIFKFTLEILLKALLQILVGVITGIILKLLFG